MVFLAVLFLPSKLFANDLTLTDQSIWKDGTFYNSGYTDSGLGIKIDSYGSWGAQAWKTPDKVLSVGVSFASDGTDIYVVRGYGDTLFWKYSTSTDTWQTLSDLPKSAYYGADITYLNGYIYCLFGASQDTFARYSIENNSWETLKSSPELVYQGGSIATDGVNIFATPGNSSQSFYRYNVVDDTWTTLAGTPSTMRGGADLAYYGGVIYTPRGNGANSFYSYTIATNAWVTLANVPGSLSDDVDITVANGHVYVSRQNGTADFYDYNISGNTWSTLVSAPYVGRYGGVQYVSGNGYIYYFRANGTYSFWKYDIEHNVFIGPKDTPVTFSTGSYMVYYAGNIYALRGANTSEMYKYNISGNSWSTLTPATITFNDDTRGVLVGTDIYYLKGSSTNVFVKYSITYDTWATLSTPNAITYYGAALSYPGTGNFIYATRGGGTSTFWRYTISTDLWEATIANLPSGVYASYGSTLTSDGTDLYFTAGLSMKRMYKYIIGSNTWVQLANLPFSPYYGNDATYNGSGRILVLAGNYTDDLWEYTISSNSWRKLKSFNPYGPTGVGAWAGASIVHSGLGVFYVTIGGRPEVFIYNAGSTNYESYGSWTSIKYDLKYVNQWDGITVDSTITGDSSITLQTRSSADNITWSSWENISGGNSVSPVNRYIQFKALLLASTGYVYTPILKGITLSYSTDVNNPGNPVNVQGFSQEVNGTSIASGTSYTYTNPYFIWESATDNETDIVGYYVYFGSTSNADPVEKGSFQNTLNYTVSKGISVGSNYLRIVSEDSLGNKSSPYTAFEYVYDGVAPVISFPVETEALTGTNDDTQVTASGIKLENVTGGFWKEERLTYAPVALSYGTKNVAYVESSKKFYVAQGANNTQFYEYATLTDTWTRLADAPQAIYYGGGAVAGPSGYIYMARGGNTSDFWKYNIASNTWDSTITGAPLTIAYGGSLVFDGSQYIYALRGNNSDFFWRYDTFADMWESLDKVDFGVPSTALSNNVYVGGSLAIDRTNQLIYATQGNYLPGFSVYSINTNQWTPIGIVPSVAYYGGSITYYPDDNSIYYTSGDSKPYFYEYDIDSNIWTRKMNIPAGFNYGGAICRVNDYIYGFRATGTTTLYRYDIKRDSWLTPTRGLFSREFEGSVALTIGYGGDLLKGDGSNYYITRGNYADDFVKWNEDTGEITRLPSTPMGMYYGGSMVYDSEHNKIYLTGGVYDRGFFVYDITTNSWSEEVSDKVPATANNGSSMVFDGNRYIYMNRGGSGTTLYRFDTEGTVGTKWGTMTGAPGGLGWGSEIAINSNYIYALRGDNIASNPFYRYDITGNSWTSMASLSNYIYNEGFLTNGNDGYLYATRGGNTTDFMRYSITGNSWSTLPAAPGQVYTGGSGESNGLNMIYSLIGGGTNSYADALYTYVMQTENSGFVKEGEYVSQVHDLTSVYKWGDLTFDYQINDNTSLLIETSSSADNENWDTWSTVTKGKDIEDLHTYKINSLAKRYLKLRFTLMSGDGVQTPVVTGYTINYYQDIDEPTNPSPEGFNASSSQNDGQSITSGSWYNFPSPYFSWSASGSLHGATDGLNGSGISGYYVYWGQVDDAKPEEVGTFQTGNSFIPGALVNENTYYLRIKTADYAGNLSTETWQPYIYKYDSNGPSSPANLNADPAGYTSISNFSFTWDAVVPVGAPVTQYCYKTGATSGDYSTDQCQEGLSISSVPAYKVGTNLFYVKAKDSAQNYSPYASISYFYVDYENAPAPPLNLRVTPVSSTSNLFGFEWDPPAVGTYFGSQSNLSYLYSVNSVPTQFSTSATSLKYLNPGAYATLPGENTFYIVSKDEAGNVNYSNYTSVSFFANTVAPGIPTNVEIADVSVKNNASWRLAVSWDPPEDVGSGVGGYQIYRSVDGEHFFYHLFTSGESLVDSKLIQVTYYYKIKACDNTNNCGAFSSIVSAFPDGRYTEPASMIVDPIVSDIAPRRVNISWITSRTADSKVAYGEQPGVYFTEEISNSDQVVDHNLTINNLKPGTVYYFVAKWTDEDGNTGTSVEATFTTAPPPTIEEPIVKNISLNSALIEFKTKDSSKIRIYYGETSTFGGMVEVYTGTQEGTHSVELSDIKDGTKYYYKINTFDIDGSEYEGEIHSFETLPRPEVLGSKIYQVTGTSSTTLLVEWNSNTPISSIVTYYPSAKPAQARDEVNVSLKNGQHRMILLNLEPNTTYSIIVKGRDFIGNEASSGVLGFKTASDTRPPQVFDFEVTSEVIGSGQEATAQLVVSYKTDEEATAQIEYGEGTGTTYTQKSQEDGNMSENHIVIISGLTPSKVYHLRAVSKDEGGNLGYSIDKVIVTTPTTENALDLAIKNLTSIFSFLGGSK
jgi:hypothetical protein